MTEEELWRMEHYEPRHPRMSRAARAAQFSPFESLNGYGDQITETARLTDNEIELDDLRKAELDERLNRIRTTAEPGDVTFLHFVPDGKKSGGRYVRTTGTVKRIDETTGVVTLSDGSTIPISTIRAITGTLFDTDY